MSEQPRPAEEPEQKEIAPGFEEQEAFSEQEVLEGTSEKKESGREGQDIPVVLPDAGTVVEPNPVQTKEQQPTEGSVITEEPKESEKPELAEPVAENKEKKNELNVPVGSERREPPKDEAEEKKELEAGLVKTFDKIVEHIKYGKGVIYGEKDEEQMGLLYEKTSGLFEKLTGRNLEAEAKVKARQDAEAKGKLVIKKSEWNGPENTARFTRSVEKRNYGAAVRVGWDELSDQERQQYHGNIKEYIKHLEANFKNIKGNVVELNRDAYYELIRQGYKPESFKVAKSFWGRKTVGIEMIASSGKMKRKKIEELSKMESDLGVAKQRQVKEAMDNMYGVAVANWKKRNLKAAGELIVQQVGSAGLAKGLELEGSDASVISNMDPEAAAKEVWTPKLVSIERAIDAVEQEANHKTNILGAIVEKIGQNKAFQIPPEEIKALQSYVRIGGDKAPKVPGRLSPVLARLIAKQQEINQDRENKKKPLIAEKLALETRQTQSITRRIEQLTAQM